MHLDKYLSEYHFNEVHKILVHSTPERIYSLVEEMDLTESGIVALLFRLRGLPKQVCSLKDFVRMGFILLEEERGKEVALGLIGRPWEYNPVLVKANSREFRAFQKENYVKVAWNIHLSETGGGKTCVTTETRIYCTDKGARRKFAIYWLFICQFSGLIRMVMLRLIKREAEGKKY